MPLKSLAFAAALAASTTLPALAAEKAVVLNGEAGIVFVPDTSVKSKVTREEVRALARGKIEYGEVGSPFQFDAVMLRDHPMLTREEVRQMLVTQGAIYVMPGA